MRHFQKAARWWVVACFGEAVFRDARERAYRLLEEALEVAQAAGADRDEAHRLVDYVFGRPTGEIRQEFGGLMVTAAVLAELHSCDLEDCGIVELRRCWDNIDKIRAKGLAKRIGVGSSIATGGKS